MDRPCRMHIEFACQSQIKQLDSLDVTKTRVDFEFRMVQQDLPCRKKNCHQAIIGHLSSPAVQTNARCDMDYETHWPFAGLRDFLGQQTGTNATVEAASGWGRAQERETC